MNILIKFKKIIFETCALRELIHYRKDLMAQDLDNPSINKTPPDILSDLKIDHYARLPFERINMLDGGIKHVASEEASCLIAAHKTETAGCILFDLKGEAKLTRPFKQEFTFNNGAYLYGLFVKEEFRGRGIGKLLYNHSFKILKNKFNYAHILVDSENLAPNKIAKQLGFSPIKKLVLIKFFGSKLTCGIDGPIGNTIYAIARVLIRFFIVVVKTPFCLLAFIRDRIEDINYKLFLKLYTIHNPTSKESLKVGFICKNKPNRMLLNLLFPDGYAAMHIKTFPKQKLNVEFNDISKNVDLTVVEEKFDYLRKKLPKQENIKFIPVFITQTADVPASLNDFSRKRDRSAYEDIRTAKIRNYVYEFIKDDEKLLVFFYENMHLPYITKRYNGEEIIIPFNLIKRSFKNGGLLLLKDNNKYLSGSVVEFNNTVLHPKFIGILNGDTGLLKKDALTSLYYFYFKFASENGFKTIDLGLSRALLDDGVLRYKAKWKTKIEFDKKRSNVFAFRISKLTEPVRAFLVKNPFISIENNKLMGNVSFETNNTLNEKDTIKKYLLNGISELKIIYLNGNKNIDSDLKIHNLSPAVV